MGKLIRGGPPTPVCIRQNNPAWIGLILLCVFFFFMSIKGLERIIQVILHAKMAMLGSKLYTIKTLARTSLSDLFRKLYTLRTFDRTRLSDLFRKLYTIKTLDRTRLTHLFRKLYTIKTLDRTMLSDLFRKLLYFLNTMFPTCFNV